MKLVNRFEDEVIYLNGVDSYYISPRFKEIRIQFNNGGMATYSAVTYDISEGDN